MSLPPQRYRRTADEHGRARTLAAQRIDGPIGPESEAWLAEHLDGCAACRAVADGFAADHALFAGAGSPVPPRDLWARTAARLERETRSGRHARSFEAHRLSAGVLAAALVVAVVVGASVIERGMGPAVTSPSDAAASGAPARGVTAAATPIAVDTEVGVVRAGGDGTYGILTATIDEVCGASNAGECRAQTETAGSPIRVGERPKSVVQSPNGQQIAVVLSAGQGSSVVIVPAPSQPSPDAAGTSAPPSPASGPSGTVATPTAATPSSPAASAAASPTAPPTASLPSISPPASVGGATPSPATPTASIAAGSPSPSVGVPVAIAEGLTVLGQTAAYSPSGEWFAFSARPTDGSHGPDIYVWHVGDGNAHAVTADHRSIFSTWLGEQILGSRAEPLASRAASSAAVSAAGPTTGVNAGAGGVEARTVSFVLDPASGASRIVPGDGIWRPVLDPSGRFAVYWSGTIAIDANGLDWRPDNGTLILARWDPTQLLGESTPTVSPDPLASGPAASPATPIALLARPPVGDWEARWDESGSYLAVWVAGGAGASEGRLTLHTVDPSGTIDASGAPVADEVADAGFAIGDGRLAWVAPQGRTGSVVKVYAWTGTNGGTAETTTLPEDTLVIR